MRKGLTLEGATLRIEKHLHKKYPDLKFEVIYDPPRSATIWFETDEGSDWFAVMERAGNLATDILVDYDYWIHVLPRIKQHAL